MATIRTLNVSLKANIANFQRNMRSAKKDIAAFAKKVKEVSVRIVKYFSALAIGVGVALGAMVKNAASRIDELAKSADRLGLSTEQLAAFRNAAELAGVSSTDLATGLRFMLKNVSDAAAGVGEAKDALAGLRLDATKLKALAPGEMFKTIAEAMSRIPNAADRMQFAMRIFGRSGGGLINLFEGGADALEAQEKYVRQIGLAIDRIDARKVERMNDTWTQVFNVVKGFANVLAVQVAPLITAIGDRILGVAMSGRTMQTVVSEAFDAIANKAMFAVAVVQAVANNIVNIVLAAIVKVAVEVGKLTAPLESMLQTMLAAVSFGNNGIFVDPIRRALSDLEMFQRRVVELGEQSLDLFTEKLAEDIAESFGKMKDAFDKMRKSATDIARSSLLDASGTPLGTSAATAGALQTQTFRQISLVRTYVPGLTDVAAGKSKASAQNVKSEQFQTMIQLLRDLVRMFGGGITATA